MAARQPQAGLRTGKLGERFQEPYPGAPQVWALAWRCKLCGHVWIARVNRVGGSGEEKPKKCAGCDGRGWR